MFLPGFSRFDWVWLGFTRIYWVLQDNCILSSFIAGKTRKKNLAKSDKTFYNFIESSSTL